MRFNRRSFWLAIVALFSAATIFAACTDRDDNPLGPETPEGPERPGDAGALVELARLTCVGDVARGRITCDGERPDVGEASADEVYSGSTEVKLLSSNIEVTDSTFAFDTRVQNLMIQKIGTVDGAARDTYGIRPFFRTGPSVTAKKNGALPASISVKNPDGIGNFRTDQPTNGGWATRPYFRYDTLLATNETSTAKRWVLKTENVANFSFSVYVAAQVPLPSGWIEVVPADTITLAKDSTAVLVGRSRDYTGAYTIPADVDMITWSSSDSSRVVVDAVLDDSTVRIKAIAPGAATILASAPNTYYPYQPNRTGTAPVEVSNNPVTAGADSVSAIGNRTLRVPAPGLLANDSDPDGGTVTVVPETDTTVHNGRATLQADGSFTYLSAPGFSGIDTITYRATDGIDTVTAQAVVRIDRVIWYVQGDGNAAESGKGSDVSPFSRLKTAADSSSANEDIFVRHVGHALTQEGITLKANQALTGEAVAAPVVVMLNGRPDTLLNATGTAPVIAPASGAAVTLGGNNTVQGLRLAPAAGAGIKGANFGLLTAQQLTVRAGGPALDLDVGTVAASLDSLSSVNSGGLGMRLRNLGGFVEAVAGEITTPADSTVAIYGGSAGSRIVYRGSLNSARPVVVQTFGGDSVVFANNSKVLNTGALPGVVLSSNTGAVNFRGGLSITTSSGAGFTATGGGTVNVTGTNTVSTGTGTPVTISGTTIGSSGVVFQSVSTTGTATNGILLANTGAGGFLAGGGTVTASGAAVSLNTTGAVTLQSLTLNGGSGIVGSSFGTLTTSSVAISANGGPALDLTTGTVAVGSTFTSVSSVNTTAHGVRLSGVNGGFATSGGTVIGGTGAFPAFLLSGGNVAFTWSGSVSQATAQPLLQVNGSHSGTATFQLGALSATQGTGLQFGQASGTYHLNGTTSLDNGVGGNAGIDFATDFTGTVNVLPVSGHTALVRNPSGAAIDVAGGSGALTYGGRVIQANNAALLNVAGGHSGTLSFASDTLRATNGTGLQFNNADGTYDFDGSVVLNGGDAAIDVTGVSNASTGTFTFTPAAGFAAIINDPTNEAVRIANSSPTFTYAGTITKDNNGNTGITISGSGGSVTFSGASKLLNSSAGSGSGVNITTNSATVSFTNGGLAITTASGTGFNATGGGTVNVPDDGANTVASSSGVAVNIQNTNIGASDVVFDRVDASGGANGIALVNTGNTGGDFVVTGNGTNSGTGGSITNTTGADGAVAGNGVYLENTRNIDLRFLLLSGHGNHAIRGSGVVNFTLTKTRITGTNGTNAGFNEGSISFDNLTGTASITGSYVEGGFEDNVRVSNSSGTLNRLTMTSDTIGHNGSSGNDGLLLDGSGTATLNVTVQNSRFTGSRSNNVHYVLNGSAAGDFVFNNNVLTNNHPNKLGSDFGINVGSTSNGAMTYTVSGNTVNDAGGSGIEVSHLAGGSGAMTGSITGNTVGTAGVSNSGSAAGSTIVAAIVGAGTTATHTTTITGNTLRQFTNYGIRLINRGTGTGYLNATVKNNNIAVPSPNSVSGLFPTSGIRAELGATSGPPADDGKTCLDISGNTVNQTGTSSSAEIRVFGRFSTKTSLLGLGQGGASAVPNTFLQNQNTVTVAPGGFGAVNATSTNPFQSTCPPV